MITPILDTNVPPSPARRWIAQPQSRQCSSPRIISGVKRSILPLFVTAYRPDPGGNVFDLEMNNLIPRTRRDLGRPDFHAQHAADERVLSDFRLCCLALLISTRSTNDEANNLSNGSAISSLVNSRRLTCATAPFEGKNYFVWTDTSRFTSGAALTGR